MDRKTAGIIATIAATLLCGCPGMFLCLFGGLSAAGLGDWTSEIQGTSSTGTIPTSTGIVLLCIGVFLIVVPIVVGVLTLRKKTLPEVDELPPTS